MKLVITDSGLGGLSVCAKLLQLLSDPPGENYPNNPADDLQITYINAVPSNNRGYNSMSGKAEQLKTFEIILRTAKFGSRSPTGAMDLRLPARCRRSRLHST